jgi:cyclophilin family peptidyl-prolyl cis-trans isomerase
MIGRVLFSLSAVALIAAQPAPAPAPAPKPAMLSVIAPQDVASDPSNRLTIELSSGGSVVIMLRPDAAPQHVERIKALVRQGFYNGLTFHRVVPGFMAQGGDPKGTGQGGSELPDLKAEFNTLPFLRGTFGAARANDKDSANSQFFIMLGPNATLNNNYTVMGRVVEGMTAVDAIAPGEPPAEPTKIVRASLGG